MNSNCLTREAQRKLILAHLQAHGTITTIQARQELDIMHPAARVQELREEGYRIDTYWTYDAMRPGEEHRVALYVLHPSVEAA